MLRNPARWHPSRRARAWLAVGLAITGVLVLWVAFAGSPAVSPAALRGVDGPSIPLVSASTAEPVPERLPERVARHDVRDRISGLVLPESDPVTVSLPRIGVRSSLIRLGLDGEGAMEVPDDPALAGWFSRGAAPGALGPAVIAGHVTWDGAPAVFHRLGTVRRGDRVTVAREDGRTAVFTVTRVAQYSKSRFPSRAVYGAIDHAGLRLITCGGTYDRVHHRYLDNIVVFARLEAVRRSAG